MDRLTCGYHSCKCRGVSFISRSHRESEYCISGRRVRVRDDGAVWAYDGTAADVEALSLHLLREYANYCAWHVKQKTERPGVYGAMKLQPFQEYGSWPLRLVTGGEWDDPQWLEKLFAGVI